MCNSDKDNYGETKLQTKQISENANEEDACDYQQKNILQQNGNST